jgi:putative transposase
MGRPKRVDVGGYVYHVLNRAGAGVTMFDGPADYQQFEEVLAEAAARTPMRLLAYCLMPNHWHLVLWPEQDGALARCMTWLTLTHTQRWHARRGSAGSGHLYQGRYKSFLVQADDHLLAVCRYVERNPLRARLVRRAEAWRWGSLWRRARGRGQDLLADWPIPPPTGARWSIAPSRAPSWSGYGSRRSAGGRSEPIPGSSRWSGALISARPCARAAGRRGPTAPIQAERVGVDAPTRQVALRGVPGRLENLHQTLIAHPCVASVRRPLAVVVKPMTKSRRPIDPWPVVRHFAPTACPAAVRVTILVILPLIRYQSSQPEYDLAT